MASLKEHLNKLREERNDREKARIAKLRELNFKKYSSNDSASKTNVSTMSFGRKLPRDNNISSKPAISANSVVITKTTANGNSKLPTVKKNLAADSKNSNGIIKRPITAPENNAMPSKDLTDSKPKTAGHVKSDLKLVKSNSNHVKSESNHVEMEKKAMETKKADIASKVLEKSAERRISKVPLAFKLPSDHLKAKGDDKSGGNNEAKNRQIPRFARPELPKRSDMPKITRKSLAAPSENKHVLKPARQSFMPRFDYQIPKIMVTKPTPKARKSMQPQTLSQSAGKVDTKRQSVFERLYQPKIRAKPVLDDVKKQKEPEYNKKLLKNSRMILNKRHSVFEPSKVTHQPQVHVRRSISAVHFKRINKNEMDNCIHKCSSVDKLDKVSLQDKNEDENVKQDKIISAIKSERKRVKFQTPVPNFNTPKPEELQRRLQNWLKNRGKSLDSYHHLQCFGISHLTERIRPFDLEKNKFNTEPEILSEPQKIEDQILNKLENGPQDNENEDITGNESQDKFESFEDDNKENEPLASDSDNDSYTENMNERPADKPYNQPQEKWRKASFVSDSMDLNDTQDTTLTGSEMHHVDELLLGALNDLTAVLREGFDWEQSASWLRAIRERFPYASDTAAYWECRAALEERRGDLPASVQCWENAIAKGTERSVVEANLDQLLDKFMQLKISPTSGRSRQPDPKMLDVKNVFKSTLIRFAVQQAKLRQSQETPKFTVTPVRRSARLSSHWSGKRTPLRVCTSVKQAGLLGHPVTFVPNKKIVLTP